LNSLVPLQYRQAVSYLWRAFGSY